MSRNVWKSCHCKRLEFGRLGGNKVEYILAGALALIIVLSLLLTFKGLIWGGGVSRADVVHHFICQACRHEFEKTPKELAEMSEELGQMYRGPDAMMLMQMGGPVLDCPQCGAKRSCWLAMRCPNCQKWFVSEAQKAMYEAHRTRRRPPANIRHECPHCKIDIVEWHKQHSRKKK